MKMKLFVVGLSTLLLINSSSQCFFWNKKPAPTPTPAKNPVQKTCQAKQYFDATIYSVLGIKFSLMSLGDILGSITALIALLAGRRIFSRTDGAPLTRAETFVIFAFATLFIPLDMYIAKLMFKNACKKAKTGQKPEQTEL